MLSQHDKYTFSYILKIVLQNYKEMWVLVKHKSKYVSSIVWNYLNTSLSSAVDNTCHFIEID